MKPYPFELLNHLTLPVILDITTNPPNDSVKRARAASTLVCFELTAQTEVCSTLRRPEVNACEPAALLDGALSETHNQQKMHGEKRCERNSSCTYLRGRNQKTHCCNACSTEILLRVPKLETLGTGRILSESL